MNEKFVDLEHQETPTNPSILQNMTEKSHLSGWYTELEKAEEKLQNQVPKIQRVAHHLRDREHFSKHYTPMLMSIGPIHHGKNNLKLGEKYKLMWADMYLKRTKQDARTLHQKIQSNMEHLKELFAEDVIEDFPDNEKLSWMLFVDGCSLLQILEKGKLENSEEMKFKVDQLVLVWQDVLLLENQLPFQVLKLLCAHQNEAKLRDSMNQFLCCHHLSPVKKQDIVGVEARDGASFHSMLLKTQSHDILQGGHRVDISQEHSPNHLLDQLRRVVLIDPNKRKDTKNQPKKTNEKYFDMITHRNIQELRAAGIRVKTSKSRSLREINFSCGWLKAELKLPEIIVDDSTATTFLNLIAYEMCHDFKNDYGICSFVAFMDSLIDNPEDVKELRSEGVLVNSLGSDEQVATLFNTISTDLVTDTERYKSVKSAIEKHYRNKCKTWIALGYHTYFSNPWAIIAFHAALIALVLTFVQTWFAIYPRG